MAFGNATKGYVRSHAGGGGGGGDIQVKLSDITDINLNNVQNAQTLLYNALSQKWENGSPETPSILDITADASTGVDASGYNALIIIGRYLDNKTNKSWCFSGIYPIDMLSNDTILTACDDHSNVYCDVTVNNSTITVTKDSSSSADRNIYKLYLIK